jgi:putative flippase GtrA
MLPAEQTQVRFFKAMIVGGAAAVVNFAALSVCARFMRVSRADNVAYFASVAAHYLLNRFWALQSTRADSGRQFLEYAGTVAVGWAIQHGTFLLCYSSVHMALFWAKAFSIPPATLAVFLLLHGHVFRNAHVTRRRV